MTAPSLLALRPHGGFGLILADPPWRYLYRGQSADSRGPERHYPCMDLGAIQALPVGELAARDCVLWLWTTHAFHRHAYDVLEAWGFRPSTGGTWVKLDRQGRPKMGGGYRHRICSEPYLIGVRGSPRVVDRGIPNVILAQPREHSRKPEEAYDLAPRYVPPGTPRLELFARQRRPGWAAWGSELDHFPPLVAAPAALAAE